MPFLQHWCGNYQKCLRQMLTWLLFIIHILVLGCIIWLIYQKSQNLPLQHFFFPAVLVKLCAGIMLGILYQWYFKGGDTLNFFHDAVVLSSLAQENGTAYLQALFADTTADGLPTELYFTHQPRALIFSKIVSFFSLITYNNYWLTSLYLSLLSFLGIWYLVNQLEIFFPNTRYAAAIAFLFFPSFVFWSSGVMKESIAMPALCILIAFTLSYLKTGSSSPRELLLKLPVIILLLWLLWQLKYYYFGVLVPVLCATLLASSMVKKTSISSAFSKALIWILVFTGLLGMASFVHPNLQFDNFAMALVQNHDLIYKVSDPENVIHYDTLVPTWKSLLKNSPEALFSGLFRPLIWEMHSPFHSLLGIENSFLLIFSILAVFKFARNKIDNADTILLLAAMIYILLLATLLGLASPNFGSLARYRVGFLPFLVYIVLGNFNLNKFRNFLPKV
jgi:hypothetical protein